MKIKFLLKAALTDRVNDREVYRKGIDQSYHYKTTTYSTLCLPETGVLED